MKKVKVSLHLHSHEDSEDGKVIDYSLFELIDRAAAADFKVLASTCHLHNKCRREHIDYAEKKDILLIPGVELELSGKHVLVLNGDEQVESLSNLEQLRKYKNEHPEIFVIVPHPNHGMFVSLTLKRLKNNRGLIDAVEHSWYYTKHLNPNRRTGILCSEINLPFIATSDLHVLDFLETDYAVAEIEELTVEEVFKAIRNGQFKNVSQPKSFLDLFIYNCQMAIRTIRSLFHIN